MNKFKAQYFKPVHFYKSLFSEVTLVNHWMIFYIFFITTEMLGQSIAKVLSYQVTIKNTDKLVILLPD